MTIANHKTIYFDKIERTNKLQTLVAIANAAVNLKDKEKVIKALESALDIYKTPKKEQLGSGSYEGTQDQWNSKYTLSRDFGLIEESRNEIILSEFGKKLANGEISAKYFISTIMLNYIQIIDEKIVNPLNSILSDMQKNNSLRITKNELKEIDDFKLNGNDKNGYINGLVDILKDTYFFNQIDRNTLEINKDRFTVAQILTIVNTEKLFLNIDEISNEYNNKGQKQWCEYLSKENEKFIQLLAKVNFDHKNEIRVHTSNKEYNRIIFGAPGTGKSYLLNLDKVIFEERYERVTFHPSYSYGQFVGAYKPIPSKDGVTYEYVPGPFMRTLVKALKSKEDKSNKSYLLIIEEINRANVASVFGDVFQLLDRTNGFSEYEIEASEEMKAYIQKSLNNSEIDCSKIKIPDNMYIWATMNSADQGVFPMDTAFKRRWNFEYMDIDANEKNIEDIIVILGRGEFKKEIKWNTLRKKINEVLLNEYHINEDKLLGPYFISKSSLKDNENKISSKKFIEVFKNKIIMYLYEDALGRQYRKKFFKKCGENITYSNICNKFDEIGVEIFEFTLDKISEISEE
ncbi:MAG: McrB family protein [Clostridium sp.]|uniref:McrB family protein n=1 Tax=Clostridium sp. TaxID=1506 RepID=UPI003EE67CDB